MCQNLALTVLYVPVSGRDCLACAKIWPCLSFICQNLALTVLHVPHSLDSAFEMLDGRVPPSDFPALFRAKVDEFVPATHL